MKRWLSIDGPLPLTTELGASDVRRDSALDGLRAVAILSVLIFHLPVVLRVDTPFWLAPLRAFGWVGVDLFFVLSGFLVGLQAFAPGSLSAGQALRQFWTKRWLRTLPLYYAVLFAYAVLKPALFNAPFRGNALSYSLLIQNYSPLEMHDFLPSWSLCIEEHFYLVFPLLVFVPKRRQAWPAWVWLIPALASLAGRLWMSGSEQLQGLNLGQASSMMRWPTHLQLDSLAVGVFLARTAPTWKRNLHRIQNGYLGGGALGLAVIALGSKGPLAWSATVQAILFPVVLAASFGCGLVGLSARRVPVFLKRPFFWLATLSYGAYLWHSLAAQFCDRTLPLRSSWALGTTAYLVLSFFAAWMTYRWIELPGLRFRQLLLKRWSQLPEQAHAQAAEGP